MRFEVVSTYEKSDLAAIYTAMNYQVWAEKPWSLFLWKHRLPIALVFVAMGLVRVFYMAKHGFDGGNLFFSLAYFVLAWMIVKRPTENNKTVRWLWNNYDRKGMEMRFCFEPEEMNFSSGGETQTYQYESVLKILENSEYFFLSMDARQISCALRKSNFAVGSADSFREFITERTSVSVEYFM